MWELEFLFREQELTAPKVCGGAGAYRQGAGVYRQNQKYGIAQVKQGLKFNL